MVATPEPRTLKKPLRVLLVEDSENDALLVVRELGRAGYEVDHERVYTPEAMREALRSPWGVIISDYKMPRFSALDALEMANDAGSNAPFIVVSGRIGEDVAVEAMRGGAYDYVMKSNLSRLPQTVERGLEKAEERRQRRKVEQELERRDAILEAVRFAADQFLGEAAGWEESVRAVLRRLGEATEASRVYVCENYTGEDGELGATLRYEWVAKGIIAQIDYPGLKGVPYKAAGFGRWIDTLGRGDLVHGHVRDLPESERPELQFEDILSIVLVPIFVEGRWWGYIGFDECVEEREWSAAEIGALGAAAGTLGAALRRRRTEEQLRGSEERYRAVIEQATDGIYLLDTETRRFVETNPSFRRMFGYTAEEVGELDIYDLVAHPRENVDATIERTLKSRRRIVGERKYRRKDGALLDVEVGVSVISLDGRDVICTIVRDVTERKKSEEALAQSEGRLRQIIETEPECVKVLGANGSLLEMNPAGLAMIEADSLEQVRGRSVYSYIAPGHREAFVALTEKVLRGGSGTLEFELVGLKGTRRWLETHAVPLRDAGDGASGLLAITRDVTKRKEAEKRLQDAEFKYRTLVERIPATIYIQSPRASGEDAYAVAYMSPQVEKLLGHPAQRFVEDSNFWDSVTHPEDLQRMEAETGRTDLTGEPFAMEYRMLHKDGGYRWIRDEAVLVTDEQDTPLYWQGVFSDVTKRKRAEAAMTESERLYRTVIEQATENIFLIDVETRRIVESNRAFREALGYSEDELHRMTLYDVVSADRDSVDHNLRRTLEEGRASVGERKYRRKDGTLLDVEASGSMILRDGRQTLVAVAHDITERKQNEEALRESEERFRSAFESAGIGMALVGPDGSWLRVNQPLCDIVGYQERELLDLTFQDITHPDDLDADVEQVQRMLRGEIHSYQMEKRYLHKNGPVVWILLSVSLVRDEEGDPLYFISQMQDITQSKRAEEALEESRRALATLMSNLPGMAYRCRNDEDRTMQFVSEGCLGLTGYSPGDLVGNRLISYGDLVHPDDGEMVWESVQAALGERRPFQFTYRITTASGTCRWVWEQGQGVFSPSGELVALEGFVTDTTERKRVQELLEERVAALSRISAGLTLDLSTGSILDALAESAVRAGTAVACSVNLLEEGASFLRLEGSYGLPEGFKEGMDAAWRDPRMGSIQEDGQVRSSTMEALRTGRRVLASNMRAQMLASPLYEPIHGLLREVPWDTVFIVPLVSRGRVLGVINFGYLPGEEPGEDEQVFLGAVADQAAITVENARLFANVRGKAALEERQRLARELHDSVSQALYGIALGVETARELLPEDPERAAEPLGYATALAEAGMTEMRALIFELRPESLESEGLVAALEKQAAAVQARHGIRVDATFGEEPEAPLETKESLYRIAQEALHNTVKHSHAANATLNLTEDPEGITLEVSDDGKGFDARGDFPGHLGLKSMNERVSRLGGTLEVTSGPGQGVRILARVPR